jgi:hypothetical protein
LVFVSMATRKKPVPNPEKTIEKRAFPSPAGD